MIKQILLSAVLVSCCLLASPLSAQAKDILGSSAECNIPSGGTGSSAICTGNKPTGNPVINELNGITHIVAFVAGAAAVLLLLVGSIKYITSGGNAEKISSAKSTVVYALIGVMVAVLAAAIIEFVLNKIQ
ncbi:MAG TPA: hypothetical protein VNG32_03845 [Candidatus Dormibacteraeota bacterium]|nr:hypothetical protein [Candidatus Dormibacteraeota bacterium]